MKGIMIPTKDLTREEWLELRRNGIGGSDASVVMGKNPWCSVQQLWEDKTGKAPVKDEGSEYTYWGNVMEPIIRKEFMNRTGLKVRQKHFMMFHPEFTFMFADVDGIVTDENGEKCIFEAKTVSQYREGEWEDGNIPVEYMLQVQHYLAVCGMQKSYIAALIEENHFVYHTILRNDEMIADLIYAEKKFWNYNVKCDIRPEIDDSEATKEYLARKYEKSVKDRINLDSSLEIVLKEYKEVDSQLKDMEKKKTGLSNRLKEALGEHEEGQLESGQIVRWRRVEKNVVDTKRLRTEQPEIYDKYKNVSAYRTLTIAS